MLARIGNRMVAETQKQMFDSLLKQDLNFYHRNPSSDLITRITQNANATRAAVNLLATSLGRDLLTLIGLIGVMAALQPMLFIICVLGLPIGAVVQKRLVSRIQNAAKKEILSIGSIINTMRETAQGIRVVKAFTLEKPMQKRMDDAVGTVERISNKIVSVNARVSPLVDTLGGITVALVIVFAGWQTIYGGQQAGNFMSFIASLLMAYEPARRLGRVQIQLNKACIGVGMMYEIVDSVPTIVDAPNVKDLEVPDGEIELKNVHFAYNEAPVLSGLSLTAQAGKTTALVGLSGSGKSTIMNLIMRFWDPNSGTVCIDGQNLRDVRIETLREQISFVSQDVFLFDGTIRENIAAGVFKDQLSEEAVVEAAKAAYAHHFIQEFPNGYDTQVGELGGQLSGGQRQRIAIARAFLKNAPIVLLDEPTSALDSESEQAIQKGLAQLTKHRTTLVIAHRLATVLNADCIHVIENGRLAESGTHRELLTQGNIYAHLYDLQYSGEREKVVPIAS
jgi:ATP-binding cassette subfamily B protein